MPLSCKVRNCVSKLNSREYSHHRLPISRKVTLAKWLQFLQLPPDWQPSSWTCICSRHFAPECYKTTNCRPTLRKNAVPTLYPPCGSATPTNVGRTSTTTKTTTTTMQLATSEPAVPPQLNSVKAVTSTAQNTSNVTTAVTPHNSNALTFTVPATVTPENASNVITTVVKAPYYVFTTVAPALTSTVPANVTAQNASNIVVTPAVNGTLMTTANTRNVPPTNSTAVNVTNVANLTVENPTTTVSATVTYARPKKTTTMGNNVITPTSVRFLTSPVVSVGPYQAAPTTTTDSDIFNKPAVTQATETNIMLQVEPTTTGPKSNKKKCCLCAKTVAGDYLDLASNKHMLKKIEKILPVIAKFVKITTNTVAKFVCGCCAIHLKECEKFVDSILKAHAMQNNSNEVDGNVVAPKKQITMEQEQVVANKLQDKEQQQQEQREQSAPMQQSHKQNLQQQQQSQHHQQLINIKQEPVVRVKQENTDSLTNFPCVELDGCGEDLDITDVAGDVEDEDQKFLLDLPFLTSEYIDNLDIMEIINIDENFIDIPDDDGTVIDELINEKDPVMEENVFEEKGKDDTISTKKFSNKSKVKVGKKSKHQEPTQIRHSPKANKMLQKLLIFEEHSYSKAPEELPDIWEIKENLKTECVATDIEMTKSKERSSQQQQQQQQPLKPIVTSISSLMPSAAAAAAVSPLADVNTVGKQAVDFNSQTTVKSPALSSASIEKSHKPIITSINSYGAYTAGVQRQQQQSQQNLPQNTTFSKPNIVVLNNSIVKKATPTAAGGSPLPILNNNYTSNSISTMPSSTPWFSSPTSSFVSSVGTPNYYHHQQFQSPFETQQQSLSQSQSGPQLQSTITATIDQPMTWLPRSVVIMKPQDLLLPKRIIIKQEQSADVTTTNKTSTGDAVSGAGATPTVIVKETSSIPATMADFNEPPDAVNSLAGDASVPTTAASVVAPKYICNICQKKCPTLLLLRKHKLKRAHNTRQLRNGIMKCHKCPRTLLSRKALQNHMKYSCQKTKVKEIRQLCEEKVTKQPAVVTIISQQRESSISSLSTPHLTSSNIYAPPITTAPTTNNVLTPITMPTNTPKSVSSNVLSTYPCQNCISSQNLQPEFSCKTCNKVFNHRRKLNQHMISHSDKRFICELCNATFMRKHGLTQHTRSVHQNIKPYVCTICGNRCALKHDMKKCRHSKLRPSYPSLF